MQVNKAKPTIRVRHEESCREGEFELIEVKQKIPSFMRRKQGLSGESDPMSYRVDMEMVANYFNLDDCMIHKACGRQCMVMDGVVKPGEEFTVTGTRRLDRIASDSMDCSETEIPKSRTAILYDKRMKLHDGKGPESPARMSGIWSSCIEDNRFDKICTVIEARKATREELEWTHSPGHVDAVMASRLEMFNHTTDVFVGEGSGEAACLASGGLTDLALKVCEGEFENGFAVIRPPGHHCYYDQASGFCLVNNVLVAANVLLQKQKAKRILIVDWDVHHGNGTQAILEQQFKQRFDRCEATKATPEILFVSLHQTRNDFYPKTGTLDQLAYEGAKRFIINIPFDEVYGDNEIINAFEQIVMPISQMYDPDFVFVSAGFDAVKGDKLGGQLCSQQVFGHLTSMLMSLAKGKIVCALEGGYQILETAYCVRECISALIGKKPKGLSVYVEKPYLQEDQLKKHTDMMHRVKQFYGDYWTCLSHPQYLASEK